MDQLDTHVKWRIAPVLFLGTVALSPLASSLPAQAHAFPASEQPMVGSTVNSSPPAVVITFDSPIEALFAKLEVSDSDGQEQTAGPPSVGRDRHQLSVPLKPLKPGDYTVKWSVVAEDSHRTEGSFQFTVARGAH
jgi:methionine-rich copper-binding protein CopC